MHRRLVRAQRLGELLLDRAGEARQLGQRQRAAADTRDGLLDLAADCGGEPLGTWRGPSAVSSPEHPQHRDLAACALGVEVELERPLERRQRQLVGAERTLERMPAQPLDEVGVADDDARLRPAEELVAREADEVARRRRGSAAASARRGRGRRRAPEPRSSISGRPRGPGELGQLAGAWAGR